MIFAGLVSLDLATPALLLATTFLLGVGGALTSPAWGATIPLLVPKEDLDSATALNGVGFNVGRAAGPALGGLVIAAAGIAVPFWIFAASNAMIIAALIWWRKPRKASESLPAERLVSAVRAGVRHAVNNEWLRATLMRVLAFFPFASAFMALLPLLARHQISGGPQTYGILLGAIGVGAVGGVAGAQMAEGRARSGPPRCGGVGRRRIRPRPVRARARADHGDLRVPPRRRVMDRGADEALRVGADCAAGLGARPRARRVPDLHFRRDHGRQRGLGETLRHGRAADRLFRGGGLVLLGSADMAVETSDRRRNRFLPGDALAGGHDSRNVENNRGPVLVVVEYRVDAANRQEFLGAVDELGHARKRDGAYAWGVYEDVGDAGRFLETFTVESWLELMHLRERVSNADELLINRVRHLLSEAPRITFSVSPERPHRTWRTQIGESDRRQVGTPQRLSAGRTLLNVRFTFDSSRPPGANTVEKLGN